MEDCGIKLPLTRGLYAIVDPADAAVAGGGWRVKEDAAGKLYAVRGQSRLGTFQFLHRLLIQAPADREVDHINGDSLDNRRSNLRLCTSAQNSYNRAVQKGTFTGVKGVSFDRRNNCYTAGITVDGTLIRLGRFSSKDEAGAAYRRAATELHGEFARWQ